MAIYYFCPDVEFPSGGVLRLYSHVRILREAGYEAFVLHFKKGFQIHWFDHRLPVVYVSDKPPIGPSDTVVIPEGFPFIMKQLEGARRVVIALNPEYIFRKLRAGENWKDYGIDRVMTNSPIIRDFIRWSMGIEDIFLLESSVDHTLFRPAPHRELRVVYSRRKDTVSSMVEKIVKSRNRALSDVPFLGLENLPLVEYAELLGRSAIFLATASYEGFPRTVVEAMACGCICMGFDGLCGREIIVGSGEGQNFIGVENGDFIELSKRLADVLDRFGKPDPELETIRDNALKTAGRFTPEAEKRSVLEFWETYEPSSGA